MGFKIKPTLRTRIDALFSIGAINDAALKAHSCTRKIRYGHKESAVAAALAMNWKTGDLFDAYECSYCDGWHIGHAR